MRHSISIQPGFMYEEALRLVDAMRNVGIEASITVGGVALYPESDTDLKNMISICKAFDVVCDEGETDKENNAYFR